MNDTAFGEELDLCNMTGTYDHNIDEKGRINFPVKLREQLGESFWIARGTSGKFLAVYSAAGWKDVMRQIQNLKGPSGEKIRRWICAGAAEVAPDKQGRILVPQALRNYAGLTRQVIVCGAGKKAEIWDYEEYMRNAEVLSPEESEMLGELYL